MVVDEAGNIERSNAAMRRIDDEALRGPLQGRTLREILDTDDDLPALMARLAAPRWFESRLRDVLRPGDVIRRWAGDEIVVLPQEVAHPDHIDQIARKLVEYRRNAISTHDQLLVRYQAQQDMDGALIGLPWMAARQT